MRNGQPDEIDIQIGIMQGCEWKPGEIAERLGDVSTEAIRLRKTGKQRVFIETITAWTVEAVAKRVAAKFARADVQRRINEKAWRNVEALLDRAVTDEKGEATLVLDALALGTLREAFDRTEGKAIDRKAVLSQHTEIHQHQGLVNEEDVELQAFDLDDILGEAKRLNEIRGQALLPAANMPIMEAQVVAQPAEPTR